MDKNNEENLITPLTGDMRVRFVKHVSTAMGISEGDAEILTAETETLAKRCDNLFTVMSEQSSPLNRAYYSKKLRVAALYFLGAKGKTLHTNEFRLLFAMLYTMIKDEEKLEDLSTNSPFKDLDIDSMFSKPLED